jgi:hypothetical protein
MTGKSSQNYAGGCLCGALRYAAHGAPLYAGHCYCADCRKASGSGFVPFMGFSSAAVRFSGQSRIFTRISASGTDAVRNFCPVCGSLAFGGELGKSAEFTIYAGSPRPVVFPTNGCDLHSQQSDLGRHPGKSQGI